MTETLSQKASHSSQTLSQSSLTFRATKTDKTSTKPASLSTTGPNRSSCGPGKRKRAGSREGGTDAKRIKDGLALQQKEQRESTVDSSARPVVTANHAEGKGRAQTEDQTDLVVDAEVSVFPEGDILEGFDDAACQVSTRGLFNRVRLSALTFFYPTSFKADICLTIGFLFQKLSSGMIPFSPSEFRTSTPIRGLDFHGPSKRTATAHCLPPRLGLGLPQKLSKASTMPPSDIDAACPSTPFVRRDVGGSRCTAAPSSALRRAATTNNLLHRPRSISDTITLAQPMTLELPLVPRVPHAVKLHPFPSGGTPVGPSGNCSRSNSRSNHRLRSFSSSLKHSSSSSPSSNPSPPLPSSSYAPLTNNVDKNPSLLHRHPLSPHDLPFSPPLPHGQPTQVPSTATRKRFFADDDEDGDGSNQSQREVFGVSGSQVDGTIEGVSRFLEEEDLEAQFV